MHLRQGRRISRVGMNQLNNSSKDPRKKRDDQVSFFMSDGDEQRQQDDQDERKAADEEKHGNVKYHQLTKGGASFAGTFKENRV